MTTESGSVAAADAEFAQMAAATEQYAWEIPQLTMREKVLLAVVADVCNQTLGASFEHHIGIALTAGLAYADVRGMLRSVAFETGYPAAASAMDRLAAIERSGIAAHRAERPGSRVGRARAPLAPPAEVVAMWHAVDEGFGAFMGLQAGLIGARSDLSPRERAFAAIMCDVLYQTLQDTFRLHIGRALGAGIALDDLRAVLRFSAQFGVTRTWSAFTAFGARITELSTASS